MALTHDERPALDTRGVAVGTETNRKGSWKAWTLSALGIGGGIAAEAQFDLSSRVRAALTGEMAAPAARVEMVDTQARAIAETAGGLSLAERAQLNQLSANDARYTVNGETRGFRAYILSVYGMPPRESDTARHAAYWREVLRSEWPYRSDAERWFGSSRLSGTTG